MSEVSLEFVTGNPQLGVLSGRLTYVDDGRGAIASTSGDAQDVPPKAAIGKGGLPPTQHQLADLHVSSRRSTLLCILSVPAHMIPTDILQFAAPFKQHLHSVRVVRPCNPARPSDPERTPAEYMVLVQMDTQANADHFFMQYNGKRFNSFEEASCQVVFVASMTFDLAESTPTGATGAPSPASTPATIASPTLDAPKTSTCAHRSGAAAAIPRSDSAGSVDAAADPTSMRAAVRYTAVARQATHRIALSPVTSAWANDASTCVICMDRMESQVLTTACNHSFHVDCLVKWQDSPCPVCRFHHNNASEASTCQECQATDNLWVCLLCGSVLCGSRHEDHVRGHYNSTLHAYATEIETQQVWDFAGDGFVHRLIHNKADGKLVEIPDPSQTSEERPQVPARLSDVQEERLVHGKLEGLAYQYNTLLTSQLDEQRQFYQKQLNGLLEEQEKGRRERREKIVSGAELIAALRQQRRELENKCASATERLSKIREEKGFLRELNRSLEKNKEQWMASVEQARMALRAAQEIRDVVVPKREQKVAHLMLKLDAASAAAAAAGNASVYGTGAGHGKSAGNDSKTSEQLPMATDVFDAHASARAGTAAEGKSLLPDSEPGKPEVVRHMVTTKDPLPHGSFTSVSVAEGMDSGTPKNKVGDGTEGLFRRDSTASTGSTSGKKKSRRRRSK